MAISSITITQDNEASTIALQAVHSPLIFIADATYSGDVPTHLLVYVNDSDGQLGTYKSIPYEDTSTTVRRFLFIADEILRGFMPDFDDFYTTENQTERCDNITKEFSIQFQDPESPAVSPVLPFLGMHAARQFGETPYLSGQYDNDSDLIIGVESFPTSVYFYNQENSSSSFPVDIIPTPTPITDGGETFFRKVYTNLSEGDTTVEFYVNSIKKGEKTIRVKNPCPGFKVLKYLDKNGQYRIYPFEKYFTINDKPEKIGGTNEIITSILTAQSNSKNIGFRNEREIILIAENVPFDELEILNDLFVSPRIYLYYGVAPSNETFNWIEISEINYSEGISKYPKKQFSKVTITVTLPEWYTITML